MLNWEFHIIAKRGVRFLQSKESHHSWYCKVDANARKPEIYSPHRCYGAYQKMLFLFTWHFIIEYMVRNLSRIREKEEALLIFHEYLPQDCVGTMFYLSKSLSLFFTTKCTKFINDCLLMQRQNDRWINQSSPALSLVYVVLLLAFCVRESDSRHISFAKKFFLLVVVA